MAVKDHLLQDLLSSLGRPHLFDDASLFFTFADRNLSVPIFLVAGRGKRTDCLLEMKQKLTSY
jgi:hypothetical protein